MGIIDTLVVAIIIIFGIVVFYKALKEPIDTFVSWVKGLFKSAEERTQSEYQEVITYG